MSNVRQQPKQNPLQGREREHFKSWSSHYDKEYQEGTEEFEQRLNYWKENVMHLTSQQKSKAAGIHINGLMDMHDEEFRQAYLGYSLSGHHHHECVSPVHYYGALKSLAWKISHPGLDVWAAA